MGYKHKFSRIIKQINENDRRALESVGVFVEGETKVRCPVGQYPPGSGRVGGNLKGSYTYQVDEGRNLVQIGTPVHYGPYVELGTSKMDAQPHLGPAIEENRDRIQRLVAKEIGRGLK